MALDNFEVRVSIQKVLIGLVLVIVPLSIVGLYLTSQSDAALDSSVGGHLKTEAQMFSSTISHHLNDRIAAIKLISADPGVVDAVAAANRNYAKQDDSAIASQIEKNNASWGTPQSAVAVKSLLSSKNSETLRHYREMDPQILRIIVTDQHGVALGATAKPARYGLGGDDAWQTAYAEGKGAVSVSNILYDEPTKSYYVDVGIPVTESGTGQLAGVTLASVNITPLLATFQQDTAGNGINSYLVNSDGFVVSGPRTDVFARAHSENYAAVQDSLGSLEGRQTGYVVADLRAGRRLVGFADTGLQKISKNLGWTVLVTQDERVAAAPIRVLSQFAIGMVILALFMVTLLAVYYALHRTQRFPAFQAEEELPGRVATGFGGPPHRV